MYEHNVIYYILFDFQSLYGISKLGTCVLEVCVEIYYV